MIVGSAQAYGLPDNNTAAVSFSIRTSPTKSLQLYPRSVRNGIRNNSLHVPLVTLGKDNDNNITALVQIEEDTDRMQCFTALH